MDALLLALLLGLALDQGDRSQRLVQPLSANPGSAVLPIMLIVAAGAVIASIMGVLIAPFVPGKAGLLFFSMTLILGAAGLLIPPRQQSAPALPQSRIGLLGQLMLHRFGDRSSFLLLGVAAMTGNGWAGAIGGTLGGLCALLPPLLAGSAYEKALPHKIIRPVLGAILLLAGLACALSALGLISSGA